MQQRLNESFTEPSQACLATTVNDLRMEIIAHAARAGRREWTGPEVKAIPCLLYSIDKRQKTYPVRLATFLRENQIIDRQHRGSLKNRGVHVFDVVLKRFDHPDEVRTFEKGRFEVIHIGGLTIGRATYEPGWKWSEHVGGRNNKTSCDVEHVGIVISGRATAAMDDGRVIEMRAGDLFYIGPGHDSWVVGDEPYVSVHIMGSESYAT